MSLKISKSKIETKEFDEQKDEWTYKDIKDLPYPFTRYFGQTVELSEDLTVEDLMEHINNYKDVIDLCFYSYTGGASVSEYYQLMKQEPEEKLFIDTIILFWSTSITEEEYYMFGAVRGIITDEKNFDKIEEHGSNSFKVDLFPINAWKHCKFETDEVIEATASDDDGGAFKMDLLNKFSLFEFLQFFLLELTCYGGVEDQKREIEEFEADQKKYQQFRVDPDFASKLNEGELFAFIDEIEEQIEVNKEILKMSIEKDDFETASAIKKENEELSAELEKMNNRLDQILEEE